MAIACGPNEPPVIEALVAPESVARDASGSYFIECRVDFRDDGVVELLEVSASKGNVRSDGFVATGMVSHGTNFPFVLEVPRTAGQGEVEIVVVAVDEEGLKSTPASAVVTLE